MKIGSKVVGKEMRGRGSEGIPRGRWSRGSIGTERRGSEGRD